MSVRGVDADVDGLVGVGGVAVGWYAEVYERASGAWQAVSTGLTVDEDTVTLTQFRTLVVLEVKR